MPFNGVGRCRLVICNELLDGVRVKLAKADDGGRGKPDVDVSAIKSFKLAELKSFGP